MHVFSARAKVVSSIPGKSAEKEIFGWGNEGTLSSQQIRELPFCLSDRYPISEKVVISDVVYNQENLYHFYLDFLLPFLSLHSSEAGNPWPRLLFLDKPSEYQKNCLAFLGVDFVYRKSQATCDHLRVMRMSEGLRAKGVDHFIESVIPKIDYFSERHERLSPPDRIYIARRSRRPANQRVLTELASKFGYVKVFFEDLTFLQQISVSRNARHWLADHGAGLVHMIWGTPESLVEIVPWTVEGKPFGDGCFEDLLYRLNPTAGYHAVLGNSPKKSDVGFQKHWAKAKFHKTFGVDPRFVENALARIHESA